MEATLTQTAIRTRVRRPDLAKGFGVATACLTRLLAAIVEGGEVGRSLSNASSAQFSMLPRSEQNRLLDRG
jgi:hypothetical protein